MLSLYADVAHENNTENEYLPFIGFFIAMMSGYRLAKFNIDTEQSENFKGLPTPINAVIIASISLISTVEIFQIRNEEINSQSLR